MLTELIPISAADRILNNDTTLELFENVEWLEREVVLLIN